MSKNKDTVVTNSGISFCGLLFITFLVLKLTEVIDWSWWWITAPLWGGFALITALIILIFIVFVIKAVISLFKKKKFKNNISR